MTPCMSLCPGDGGSNNDFTVRKYVFHTSFHTKMGGQVIRTQIILPLTVSVIPKDRISRTV